MSRNHRVIRHSPITSRSPVAELVSALAPPRLLAIESQTERGGRPSAAPATGDSTMPIRFVGRPIRSDTESELRSAIARLHDQHYPRRSA